MKLTLHVVTSNDTYVKTVDSIDYDILFIKKHMEDGGLWAVGEMVSGKEQLTYIKKNEWQKLKRALLDRI